MIIASYIICADAGANWYYEMMKSQGREDIDVSKHSMHSFNRLINDENVIAPKCNSRRSRFNNYNNKKTL